MKITKEKLIEDIERVKTEIGKIPSRSEYIKFGVYGKSTIDRNFGNWNKALQKIFKIVNYPTPLSKRVIKCKYCNKEIVRGESEILNGRLFCSVSCSNRINNRRKRTKKCNGCENLIPSNSTYCKKCRESNSLSNKTIKEAMYRNDANKYGVIRCHARGFTKGHACCEICGYSRHVETCHVKPINSFSTDTLISVVNSPNNLIVLCPNCHWEFDHNQIEKERLPKRIRQS